MINPKLLELLKKEANRQQNNIELIASENIVSQDILYGAGTILTNKYAEGYPKKRYYGGCEWVDEIEQYAIDKAKELFKADHANVQPHSGSQANAVAYKALLKPGDKILGMSLDSGGHLTHGFHLNFSGQTYESHFYNVNEKTYLIDYEALEKLAFEIKPKLIVAGASAYSRVIDWKKIRKICDKVGAYLLVDMAHVAGLVATGLHPSPVPHADIVTSTTHKTLRGPRGGLVLCKEKYKQAVNSALFPGIQGGPLVHIVFAKAICLDEALKPEFKVYQKQILANVQAMISEFKKHNVSIITGGSDNHLFLINTKENFGLNGLYVQNLLDSINITLNKNTIPFDKEKYFKTSGIRIGAPAITTRGFKEDDCKEVVNIIVKCLKNSKNEEVIKECKERVKKLTQKHPLK